MSRDLRERLREKAMALGCAGSLLAVVLAGWAGTIWSRRATEAVVERVTSVRPSRACLTSTETGARGAWAHFQGLTDANRQRILASLGGSAGAEIQCGTGAARFEAPSAGRPHWFVWPAPPDENRCLVSFYDGSAFFAWNAEGDGWLRYEDNGGPSPSWPGVDEVAVHASLCW